MSKNLHICELDKFIPPFHEWIRTEFSLEDNIFFMLGDSHKYSYKADHNTHQYLNSLSYYHLLRLMYSADKIILHSLLNINIISLLALNPKLLKKCYWVIWGGDLYRFMFPIDSYMWHMQEFLRSYVIKRIAYLLTYIEGDVVLARKHYNAKGQFIQTIGYLSNIVNFNSIKVSPSLSNVINILVGNSASITNNHFDALDKLSKFKDESIMIYVPLSYGDTTYAQKVIDYGKNIFKEKFVGITEFMSFKDYMNFLKNINIAVFNHERQQAMGNTINLLAMGKKVYLRSDTTQKDFFESLNVKTFDINNIDLSLQFDLNDNKKILSEYFSLGKLKQQWRMILED